MMSSTSSLSSLIIKCTRVSKAKYKAISRMYLPLFQGVSLPIVGPQTDVLRLALMNQSIIFNKKHL